MYDYIKGKGGPMANVNRPMSAAKYKKYSSQVDELLKGNNWEQLIDDYFGF